VAGAFAPADVSIPPSTRPGRAKAPCFLADPPPYFAISQQLNSCIDHRWQVVRFDEPSIATVLNDLFDTLASTGNHGFFRCHRFQIDTP